MLCLALDAVYARVASQVGALGCPVRYLVSLLSPALQPDTACLLSAQRALRISHVWEDILCVWHPKIDVLRALTAPLRAQDTRPALLIQVLDSANTDELEWLGKEKQNYGHLLRVTIPRNPALLVVRATLKDLAAYSADFVPPQALDTLASYLLSWAATIAPFDMLTAEQLLMAPSGPYPLAQAAWRRPYLCHGTPSPRAERLSCHHSGGQASQRGTANQQHRATIPTRPTASAPGASPWQAASPASLHGHHRGPAAGSIGQDEWQAGWPCPHHAYHGQNQSPGALAGMHCIIG